MTDAGETTITGGTGGRSDGPGGTKWYLERNYRPLPNEVAAVDLPVQGALPPGLEGRYVRNGPNPRPGREPSHWFLGDGMLHGIRMSGGRAEWFKSSWVRTSPFDSGQPFSFLEDGTLDRLASLANAHVICHAGRILALYEQSFPTEVTPELETVGAYDFAGRLTTGVTAHPKRCPLTGELLFFGYDAAPPYLSYHRVTEGGELVQSENIDMPGPTMIHDFTVTATHVVWMDLPVVFDADLAMQGRFPYQWSDSYGARLGVLPRTGGNADVRWFDVDPCYVFHTVNASQDDTGTITLDVARYPELWRGAPEGFDQAASLWRWTIDTGGGTVSEQQLDDQPCEFPRVDPRRVGLANRYTWLATTDSRLSEDFGHSILKSTPAPAEPNRTL